MAEKINPGFWLQVVRTNAHTTDCADKTRALTNAAVKLEEYIATLQRERDELQARCQPQPLASVELIVGERDDTVLTITTTVGELRFLRSPAFAEMARAYDDVKSFMSRCDCGCSRYCCPQCGEELVGPLEKVDDAGSIRIDAAALAGDAQRHGRGEA